MGAASEAEFCKRPACPDSHELLAFQAGRSNGSINTIGRHLADCDFCRAEVEFYEHYPQSFEASEICCIPQPLAELAAALLRKDPEGKAIFEKLLNGINESAGTAK